MTEWAYVCFVLIKLCILGFWVMCYIAGGRGPKYFRRYIGGIGFGLMICWLALWMGRFNWWLFALPVFYPLALCIGYGSDKFWMKVFKRAAYGLAFGLIGLYSGFILNNLYLGIAQLILPVLVSVFLGVMNPVRAVDEESLIGLSLVVHIPFML